VQLPRS
jgi:hypothetical protein